MGSSNQAGEMADVSSSLMVATAHRYPSYPSAPPPKINILKILAVWTTPGQRGRIMLL